MTPLGLALRRAGASVLRLSAPWYSCCHHCGWPWKYTDHHSVVYDMKPFLASGIFFSCTTCWPVLTPEEKVKYCSEVVHGLPGKYARSTEPWPPDTAAKALEAVAHAAGANTDDEIVELLWRASSLD